MKKLLLLVLSALTLGALLSGCGSGGNTLTLNVYNWGEYISDGSEGSLDTIREFELWYEETYGAKVKVNYDTYTSNEDMYAKLSSGAVSYSANDKRGYAPAAEFRQPPELSVHQRGLP